MCPIVVYDNNEEEIGDFEPVLSLIDAYVVLFRVMNDYLTMQGE